MSFGLESILDFSKTIFNYFSKILISWNLNSEIQPNIDFYDIWRFQLLSFGLESILEFSKTGFKYFSKILISWNLNSEIKPNIDFYDIWRFQLLSFGSESILESSKTGVKWFSKINLKYENRIFGKHAQACLLKIQFSYFKLILLNYLTPVFEDSKIDSEPNDKSWNRQMS